MFHRLKTVDDLVDAMQVCHSGLVRRGHFWRIELLVPINNSELTNLKNYRQHVSFCHNCI
jgi:hypothetical protein